MLATVSHSWYLKRCVAIRQIDVCHSVSNANGKSTKQSNNDVKVIFQLNLYEVLC